MSAKNWACWIQSRRMCVALGLHHLVGVRAERVQWLKWFHPGDLCPGILNSGCRQTHLLLSYWKWCSQKWAKSSELGQVEECIKPPFIFSQSLFPRIPFADEESSALPVPIPSTSLPAAVASLPPVRDIVLTLSTFDSLSVLVSEAFDIPLQGSNYSLRGKSGPLPVLVSKHSQLSKCILPIAAFTVQNWPIATVSHRLNYLPFLPSQKTNTHLT